ncbi:MAG: metallophosphoesterase [Nanoarchaeota archaeon]|nr:metallophosphoesterase [Nanoarchaeota archaeon]MBU0962745.1 metallophosphoesterase [Nanoarchaeota archaeon]
MKILAFVDLHSDFTYLKKIIKTAKEKQPDFLVCAGDISDFGNDIEKIFKELSELNIPMLIIPGNHESSSTINQLCKKYKFAVNINKACYEVNEYCFLGYGEGGFSEEDPEFDELAEKFKKNLDKNKKLILVSHAPVYGTKVDYLSTLGHRGNKSIRRFIAEVKPKLVICGHFHDTATQIDRIGYTTIINPGKYGKIILI